MQRRKSSIINFDALIRAHKRQISPCVFFISRIAESCDLEMEQAFFKTCFVNNDYFSAAIYVREGNYLFSGLFGDNNPVAMSTCLDITLGDRCEEFDSNICLVPDPLRSPANAESLMPCITVMLICAFISLV